MVLEKITKCKNGNYFCNFGQTKEYWGTGFYINKKGGNKIVEVKGISKRVIMLKLDMSKNTKILIIQIHASTQQASIWKIGSRHVYVQIERAHLVDMELRPWHNIRKNLSQT